MNRNAAGMAMVGFGALYFMAQAKSASGPCTWAELHGAFLPSLLLGLGYFARSELVVVGASLRIVTC